MYLCHPKYSYLKHTVIPQIGEGSMNLLGPYGSFRPQKSFESRMWLDSLSLGLSLRFSAFFTNERRGTRPPFGGFLPPLSGPSFLLNPHPCGFALRSLTAPSGRKKVSSPACGWILCLWVYRCVFRLFLQMRDAGLEPTTFSSGG